MSCRGLCPLRISAFAERDFEEDGLVVGVAETEIQSLDRVGLDAVRDVEVVGDGQNGFRSVYGIEVTQCLGRGVPRYVSRAPEK